MQLRRARSWIVPLACLVATAGCRTLGQHAGERRASEVAGADAKAPSEGKKPAIRAAKKLGLGEVSGIAMLPDGGFIAVGDHDSVVLLGTLRPNGPSEAASIKVARAGGGPSQWEGVAVDGQGTAFVLREFPARILVLSPDLRAVVGAIDLDFSSVEGGRTPNSLAEGLVLLRNGHVLIAKEKDPPLLIEFGPPGTQAIGFTPESMLGPGEPMMTPAPGGTVVLVPLKTWSLNAEADAVLKDMAELAVGPDGLFVLSEEARVIGRFEGKLRPDEGKAALRRFWKLPGDIEHPEGLAFAGDAVLVGDDGKANSSRIFVLDPLEE
jgi:hypothetical protein